MSPDVPETGATATSAPPPRTGLVADVRCRDHQTGPGHPESSARFDAVLKGVRDAVPAASLTEIAAREASRDDVTLCHSDDYYGWVEDDIRAGRRTLSTGDTDIGPDSLSVARRAAGGAMAAVDAVLAGTVRNAFCVLRPPGHHATRSRGMGFCVFNNAAIAARHAQRHKAVKRVLIADWDVHHGNGTQDIFYSDPSVFYFSTHQWPLYPGTGRADERGYGAGKGTTLNCPFAAGADGTDMIGAFRHRLVPAMREFQPDLVVISAGFDAEAGDPIGGFALTPDDFAALTWVTMEVADRHAGGRIVSVLEGGYRLEGLAACAGAHVKTLAGL